MGIRNISKSELREYYPTGPRLYPELKEFSKSSGGNIISNLVKKKQKRVDPNPRADNWKILRAEEIKNNLVVEIKYPNCTNYEGRKILVYKNVKLIDLVNQKLIDPHFSDNVNYHSPFARLEPTANGWESALVLANSLDTTP